MNNKNTNKQDVKNDTEHMIRIEDNSLYEVTGGESGNRTLLLDIDLPNLDSAIVVTAYFDGLLIHSQGVHTSYRQNITLPFSASGGLHTVNVNIEGMPYKQYELDFDNGIIR